MDWKSYYKAECAAPGARKAIESWLVDDVATCRAVEERGILSFPHTALSYAGPLQARVASALYADQTIERVLVLGVLHASGLDVYRTALDDRAPLTRRADAFAHVRGAFVPDQACVETPFGPLQTWQAEESASVRRDRADLLASEFSLDTFHSVLRVAADTLGRAPFPVLSAYVGMTRDPASRSFEPADEVAAWIEAHVDAATAVVATGDLIHYGSAYGGPWDVGDPQSIDALRAMLRAQIERGLAPAFAAGDLERAYDLSRTRLQNDQREMLAVFSLLLGRAASLSLLAFDLSDYVPILDVAPPCVVASALALYEPAAKNIAALPEVPYARRGA